MYVSVNTNRIVEKLLSANILKTAKLTNPNLNILKNPIMTQICPKTAATRKTKIKPFYGKAQIQIFYNPFQNITEKLPLPPTSFGRRSFFPQNETA